MSQLPEPHLFFVDKPSGPGSTDIIRQFKRALPRPFGKIGHLGTLDPFASGLLIVGVAGATRLSDLAHDMMTKHYRAVGRFGIKTDSGDRTGNVIEENGFLPEGSFESIKKVLEEKFSGEYWQIPPQYSATKHEGKNLYEYARQGIEIRKEPVLREILSLEVLSWVDGRLEFDVEVSKGTYIRTLFEDMASFLGGIGHLDELRRTGIGPHRVSAAMPSEFLEERDSLTTNAITEWSRPVSELLPFSRIDVDGQDIQKFINGNPFSANVADSHVWVASQDVVVGLGKADKGMVAPFINFPQQRERLDALT